MVDNILFVSIIILYGVAAKYSSVWLQRLGAKNPILTFICLSGAIPVTIMCMVGVFSSQGIANKFGALALLSLPLAAYWGLTYWAFKVETVNIWRD